MAFGIGINTEHTEQEPLSGTYINLQLYMDLYIMEKCYNRLQIKN